MKVSVEFDLSIPEEVAILGAVLKKGATRGSESADPAPAAAAEASPPKAAPKDVTPPAPAPEPAAAPKNYVEEIRAELSKMSKQIGSPDAAAFLKEVSGGKPNVSSIPLAEQEAVLQKFRDRNAEIEAMS